MTDYGLNVAFVDELYARYRDDPLSVSEAWREFFADYAPRQEHAGAPQPAAGPGPGPAETEPESPAEPLLGIAGKIAENMAQSLAVPTATSTRAIPVKLLEENRRLINQHQAASFGVKISFTHLIAWGVVRALAEHPGMNAGFEERDGTPHRLPRETINLGLAIDVERRGRRLLLVPNIKDAATLGFPALVRAYNDLVERARDNKLTVEDFEGTTATLTNPGMLGTVLSVPRLMAGQGTIVGVGRIGYPAEYQGVAPQVISQLGLSKVMAVTSTYDHRVIQGAESGAFLATLERLLTGEDGFYTRVFSELNVPHEPLVWAGDQNPELFGAPGSSEAIEKQARVIQLIRAYRVRGHLLANLDPLGQPPDPYPELELSHYRLTLWDLDRSFIAGRLAGITGALTLREILDTLRETYCRYIGVEFMHMQEPGPRWWLQDRMETTRNARPLGEAEQLRILERLNAAEAFEKFVGTAYVGHKRFSLEGAETLIPMLDTLLNDAAGYGVREVVIGMAHRGRLNVLANVIGKSIRQIFQEFEGDLDPSVPYGSGDVKYHLGARGVHVTADDREVRVGVAPNPSHLEAVDPVVEGVVRAIQDRDGDTERARGVPVLIHGDGAIAGQGVVAETLGLSQLVGYRTGGTVHIVINNQIGFTTGPADARSSRYASDVAKMVQAPIFHVNGDHPEDACRVISLALEFRQRFKRDVVVDLLCYRRWGHNEADDPSYTHPAMYARIKDHRSVRKLFTEELLRRGDIDVETAERSLEDFQRRLERDLEEAKQAERTPLTAEAPPESAADESDDPQTAVPEDRLTSILKTVDTLPDGFQPHPKLARQLARRSDNLAGDRIDWALAELLAFGSLVTEGTPVRVSGEDSGRGTFSQRHATLYDHRSGERHVPLDSIEEGQAPFRVFDSHLSEFAVLGFEYGFSVAWPEALVIWEAQFGDFANGAQVIIDQFIVSAEDKWGVRSGLVLLLPHGYEGQGPDHSSARLERFLQLAARRNIRVVYPSTPAQYFHMLRRQAHSSPKPLVVMTPKSLLRLPAAVSPRSELTSGAFCGVLDDPGRASEETRRLVLCTGKVYYDLDAHRREHGIDDVALARIEQLYPWPEEAVRTLLERYSGVDDVVWVQEEPRNMGAWAFVEERLRSAPGTGRGLRYLGRPASASTATGSATRHAAGQSALVRSAFDGAPSSGAAAAPASADRKTDF